MRESTTQKTTLIHAGKLITIYRKMRNSIHTKQRHCRVQELCGTGPFILFKWHCYIRVIWGQHQLSSVAPLWSWNKGSSSIPTVFSSGARFQARQHSNQQTSVCECVCMVFSRKRIGACELRRFPALSQIISTYCIPGEARHRALHASLLHYRGSDRDWDEGWCVNVGVCVCVCVCVWLKPYSQTVVSSNYDTYNNDTFEVTLSPLFNYIRDNVHLMIFVFSGKREKKSELDSGLEKRMKKYNWEKREIEWERV